MALRKITVAASVNLVVLGAPMVGKTTFIKRFLNDTVSAEYEPTDIECSTHHIRTEDGRVQLVDFVEVSGRKELSAVRDRRIRGGDAFLVMYAVNDKKSLKTAVKICKRVYDIKESADIPLILIGHKTDLKEASGMKLKKRLSKLKNCYHMEASAQLNSNVGPVFDRILKLAHAKALHGNNDRRKRSSQQSSYYSVHMSPRRISKFAIKELHEEDVIRQQKQERSTARTSQMSYDFDRLSNHVN